MNEKKSDQEGSSQHHGSGDGSLANPGAAGRRRLLRALGDAGGVGAMSALLAPGWVKPVVQAVVLPAHAQLSKTSASSCVVTHQFGVTAANTGSFSACTSYSDNGTTILATLTTFSSGSPLDVNFTTMLSGAGNIGYSIGVPVPVGGGAGFSQMVGCCESSFNYDTAVGIGPNPYTGSLNLDVTSDGTCSIESV